MTSNEMALMASIAVDTQKNEVNEVLDKIRTELHATAEMHEDENYYLREEWIDEIIDKYTKGEGEWTDRMKHSSC